MFRHRDANPVVAQVCASEKFNAFFAEFYQYITGSHTRLLTELYAAEQSVMYIIRVSISAPIEVLDRMPQFIGDVDRRFAAGIEDRRRLELQSTLLNGETVQKFLYVIWGLES